MIRSVNPGKNGLVDAGELSAALSARGASKALRSAAFTVRSGTITANADGPALAQPPSKASMRDFLNASVSRLVNSNTKGGRTLDAFELRDVNSRTREALIEAANA